MHGHKFPCCLIHFKNGPEYLNSGIIFDKISAVELGFEKFSGSSDFV